MPKLPWTTIDTVEPETEVVVMASRLPLRRYRHIPGFMAATLRIRRQLAQSEGLVGYALDAQLSRKTFWTLSAWTDRNHLRSFDRADPHKGSVAVTRPRMDPTTFVTWTTTAGELPVAWPEAVRRVEQREEQRREQQTSGG
ncbi:MAG TPA: hypothetical protein VK306_09280 [Acidimicrobiales bacterium]|nr:hypothetical protein [Acidimicrobiales bacterium]